MCSMKPVYNVALNTMLWSRRGKLQKDSFGNNYGFDH